MSGNNGNQLEWTQEDHERDIENAFAWLRNVMRQAGEQARAGGNGCGYGRPCGRPRAALQCPSSSRPDARPERPFQRLERGNSAQRLADGGSGLGAEDAPLAPARELVKKLAMMVMAHEGGYDAVNRNTDGAGVSIGIFQWPQRSGDLGRLLREYYRADPGRFARVFGPRHREILDVTARASLEPVGGAVLWGEPWVTRFHAAGREPVFQAVQDRMAMEGPHMRQTFSVAGILGFMTERSLAVVLDAVVSQGPNAAEKVAWKVRKLYAGQTAPMREVLSAYLELAVAHFRKNTPPTAPPKAQQLAWRKVGNEWHVYAGQVDLYLNIVNRRGKLITHPELSDEVLRLSPGDLATA